MTWSNRLHESDSKLSVRCEEWKNFMHECLMATQIKRNERFSDKQFNPDVVMNVRHQMAKDCVKAYPMSRCQLHSEAMKLIREEKNQKLHNIREEKLISKEIAKLQQVLEFNGMMSKKYLETEEKQKQKQALPRITHKVVQFRTPQVNKKYQVEKIKRTETNENKNNEIRRKRGGLVNKETETPLWTDDESCDEMFKKFETEEKRVTKTNVKPLVSLLGSVNQRRVERAWQIWRIYTQKQKRKKKEEKMYVDKIEAFLRKLQEPEGETKKTGKLRITSYKGETKTFKLPQRAKTAASDGDRDEKLRKLMREVKSSQTEVFQKLRSRNETVGKAFPNPKFLSRMENRREERLKRWKEIQERKQILQEERENMKKRIEEEGKQKSEEEKRQRMEELKEKRREEKARKEEQRKRRDKIQRDHFLASSHYRMFLLRSYGLRPWMNLMRSAEAQYKQAVDFYERRLLLMLGKWRAAVRERVEKKTRRAEKLYNHTLLKRYWNLWMEFRRKKMSEEQVAVDWYDFKLTERMFRRWMWFAEKEQLEYLNKKDIADSHYRRKLKIKYLQKISSYPEFKRKELEIEIRKHKWRQKVKEILPDYQPMRITQNW